MQGAIFSHVHIGTPLRGASATAPALPYYLPSLAVSTTAARQLLLGNCFRITLLPFIYGHM